MVERGGCLRLAHEAPPAIGIVHRFGAHDLEGHRALEPRVPGLVDDAHPALPENLENEVVTHRPPDQSIGSHWSLTIRSTWKVYAPRDGRRNRNPLLGLQSVPAARTGAPAGAGPARLLRRPACGGTPRKDHCERSEAIPS